MKAYQYPLQKILDLKSSEKIQAEWVLAEAIGRLQSEEHLLNELVAERKRWDGALQKLAVQCVTVRQMQLMNAYLDHLDQLIASKNVHVKHAEIRVNEEKEHVTVKWVDEKTWEKSKEKAKHRFMTELMKKEQNELDELAVTRFAHS